MSFLSFQTINGLESALNRTSMQQSLVSQNIANVDTPGYKAKELQFSDVLKGELQAKKTSPRHLSFSTGQPVRIVTSKDLAIQNNGNNVDMDREMSKLGKTQLSYQSYVELLNHEFNQYRTVLKGGS